MILQYILNTGTQDFGWVLQHTLEPLMKAVLDRAHKRHKKERTKREGLAKKQHYVPNQGSL